MLPTSCVFRPGRFARTVQFCLLSVLPISANAERIVHFHLPAGEVATIFGSVYVGVEKVHEEQNVVLHDFGEAGVLIESHTGGAYCPSKFLLIHPDTGQLRSVNPGHDRETVFGECQRLSAVIPDLGLVVTMPETANEQARVFAWNGFRMSESVVKRFVQDVPLPAGGADVERWVDRYLFELARDPQEQKRLAEVLTEEQLEEFNRVIGRGSPMVRPVHSSSAPPVGQGFAKDVGLFWPSGFRTAQRLFGFRMASLQPQIWNSHLRFSWTLIVWGNYLIENRKMNS